MGPANGKVLRDVVPPELLKDGQSLLLVTILVGEVPVVFVALSVIRRCPQSPGST